MRNAFAEELTALAQKDERIVLLSGDIGNKLFERFKQVDERRFFNCGVAEANMMGVAAGMAMSGLRPVIYTITPFTTTRCFEQIRVDVCYHNAPVTIVGTGSGLSYAELGPTHHSLEDLAIMRSLPGMSVMAPCDSIELRLCLRAALKQNGPAYIRIGKKGEPAIHAQDPDLSIGKAIVLREGDALTILGTGTIMQEALKAADILLAHGVRAEVASMHTIKPVDTDYLAATAARVGLLATVEEHGLIGGLGSAVAEWAAAADCRRRLICLGTPDEFMHEIGSQSYARHKYGLTGQQIADRILGALKSGRS
jgi:transketolase